MAFEKIGQSSMFRLSSNFFFRNLAGEFREMLERYMAQEDADQNSPDIQLTGLRSFSLITHAFGIPTISGVMSVFQSYLSALLALASGLPVATHTGTDEYGQPRYIEMPPQTHYS